MDTLIKAKLKVEVQKRLARDNFLDYLKYINRHNKSFVVGKHIKYACEILDQFDRGEIKKLAVYWPPQHGKSKTFTETYASYTMMKHKNKKVMIASYGKVTANKFGKANLDKIEEYGESLFGVKLDKSNRSKTNMSLEGYEGNLLSTTIRGGATGFGADLLIIDDPIKGPGDNTDLGREEVHSMYQSVFKTRLSADGQEMIILTRWHEDDLAGRVVSESNGWTVLLIPCIAGVDDLLGREPGEFLFPEIGKDMDWYLETLRDVGSRYWESMYQQNPTPLEGNIIKEHYIKYYTKLPEKVDEYLFSFDLASKSESHHDYSVGNYWARCGADHYLVDQIRGQWELPQLLVEFDKFINMYNDYSKILIEDKSAGIQLIQMRKSLVRGIIPIKADRSTGGKIIRLEGAAVLFESGNVYFPKGDALFGRLINSSDVGHIVYELISFPTAPTKDVVDTVSQILNYYINHIGSKRKSRRAASVGARKLGGI